MPPIEDTEAGRAERKPPRRSVEREQLRASIQSAINMGRAARDRDPAVTLEIGPLLVRLEEISEELDRLDACSPAPVSGELYPFWIKLALGRPG